VRRGRRPAPSAETNPGRLRLSEYTLEEAWFESTVAVAPPCGPGSDPVDQVMTLWTNKTGLQGILVDNRSRLLWMSEGSMFLQLDPLDHHFDPEDQVPTLWISAN
jgi:hypothetical protein